MALRNATPFHWPPFGVSDALDATNVFKGAMTALQNLIPDPSTKDLWQCRPASAQLAAFTGAQANQQISVLYVVGNRAYGMIGNASGTFAGHDTPFSYNLVTNTFDAISGITAANTPTSQPTTGAWTPPSMSLVGVTIAVAHIGFNFAGGFAVGWLNISNPAAPVWSAGNTATNALPAVATWVAQFNGRAHYLVNPTTGQPADYVSNALDPTTIGNGPPAQVLTFGDNTPLTCAMGLPLNNQLGGIIQSLMVFKGASNIYQVTGDFSTSNVQLNSLNIATGTLSPNSLTNTPKGLMFIAPDGLRLIDFLARVSDPIGVDGQGINVPFVYSLVPSRVNACCNTNVLRVNVQDANVSGSPVEDWWFDISRQKWSGPHTFPGAMMEPYQNTFIIAPTAVNGALWRSDVVQNSGSTFVENGAALQFNWTTSFLPDTLQMSENCLIESTLNLALVPGMQPIFVQALSAQLSLLGEYTVFAPSSGTIWGAFIWGSALWGGAQNNLYPVQLQWADPIVFRRLQLRATGVSIAGLKIGDLFLRYQKLGYLQASA